MTGAWTAVRASGIVVLPCITLLAYSGRRRDGSWVGTLSPQGRLTRLSVRPAPRLAVRYAGTRVAVLRGDRDIVLAQRGRRTETVARGVAGDDHAAFDFDAQRLSYRSGTGAGTRLHLKRVG